MQRNNIFYISSDALGSINLLVNATDGTRAADLSYDAWGRRRNPQDWTYNNITLTPITDRGYTGHEMMDAFALINMNGRAYDPVVGQFLSPDPFVGDASNPQSYNRYAYCLNNPLKYTDPSGYNTEDAGWYQSFIDQNLSWSQIALRDYENYGHYFDTPFMRQQQQAFNCFRAYRDWENKYEIMNYSGKGLFGKEGYFTESNAPFYNDNGIDNPDDPPKNLKLPLFNGLRRYLSLNTGKIRNSHTYNRFIGFERHEIKFKTGYKIFKSGNQGTGPINWNTNKDYFFECIWDKPGTILYGNLNGYLIPFFDKIKNGIAVTDLLSLPVISASWYGSGGSFNMTLPSEMNYKWELSVKQTRYIYFYVPKIW